MDIHYKELSKSSDLFNDLEKSVSLDKDYRSKLENIMYKSLHLVTMNGLLNTTKDDFMGYITHQRAI